MDNKMKLNDFSHKLQALYDWVNLLKITEGVQTIDFDDHHSVEDYDTVMLGRERGLLEHYEDVLYYVNQNAWENCVRELCLEAISA